MEVNLAPSAATRRAFNGSGVVVFTAFDVLAPEFKGWQGAPALWRDLLRCGNTTISPRSILASNPQNGSTLADALADTDCADTDIFLHCFRSDEHMRGSWLVEAILGKKGRG